MDSSDIFLSFLNAAIYWHSFGFAVIPIIPGTKLPAVKWDPWLAALSQETISTYWAQHPDHELGFIVGDDVIVFDADSPAAIAGLAELEKTFDISPCLTINTSKGQHHYFRRARGTYAKSDSHSTEKHPERIDVKTGRALVVLPPSGGKEVDIEESKNVNALTEASQEFIDAVFRHNGRPAPRPPVVKAPSLRTPKPNMDQATAQLKTLLVYIYPDCGYEDWVRVLMALHHETGGSDDGLALADDWSSRGDKYPGSDEIANKWHSFENYTGDPVTVGTLRNMVADNGFDWIDVCDAIEPQFSLCEYKVIHPNDQSPIPPSEPDNPLARYSLKGKLQQLEKEAVEQVFILMYIALMGQITVFYAAPNTGKTLITLWLLIQAIKLGKVDPSKIYYINVDDSQAGLVEKLRLAEEHDFHTITEGRSDFRTNDLLDILTDLIVKGQSKGVVIILDTLKKFTDLMDKRRSTEFGKVIRRFVMQGGTCIALAHTNKNLGRDGRPVYAGTSDIIEDADCAYTLQVISDADARERVVAFVNIKRRGNVSQRAAYCYSNDDGLSYRELFDSVKPVDDTELVTLKQSVDLKSDAEVIDVVIACIREGVDTKMKIAVATAKRAGISKRAALRLIEKYAGTDPAVHKWTYTVRDHGAKVFSLFTPDTAVSDLVVKP